MFGFDVASAGRWLLVGVATFVLAALGAGLAFQGLTVLVGSVGSKLIKSVGEIVEVVK